MVKKYFLSLTAISCIFSSSAFSLTLKESVIEVLNTNPVVQERLKNYRATQQDLNIAESEYYPTLDLRASAGTNSAGNLYNHVANSNYTNYQTSLQLTQNLFDGFGTMYKVDYQQARILAAAYNYVEKSNDSAFKMTNTYLNVMRSYELLQTAKENVQVNEDIHKKVKELYDAGLTTASEVKKIESSLALARSNYIVQVTNTHDAEYNFKRLLGRMPEQGEMKRPDFNFSMPQSKERAALYAVNHNPSLLVSRYNIKGAQALWKQKEKEYYPKVDMEVTQSYNDVSRSNAFDIPDDRFSARLVLTYNLFRGGADSADIQKSVSSIDQEIEIKRDLKRQVIEGLELSWNAYDNIGNQLKVLREYSQYSEKTLELYKEEYDLGRRSLLDLLSSQSDVFNARSQIIKADYDYLLAKYRVLDAMGLLVMAVTGDEAKYASQVNLYTNAEAKEVLDTVPAKLDVDHDNIPDNLDLCDNSLAGNNIMPDGCKKISQDNNATVGISTDNQTVKTQVVPLTSATVTVVQNNVPAEKVQTPQTVVLHSRFTYKSISVPADAEAELQKVAKFLAENKNYSAQIFTYTDSKGGAKYNLKLSEARAQSIFNDLVAKGVDSKRLIAQGKGDADPIASNDTLEGAAQNRRIVIEYKKDN